jgi:hypothetical protein
MNRPIHFRTIASACLIGLAAAAVVWLGFLPIAQAVSPPPDGGYAGGNTAEGTNALFSLTASGQYNTAVGLNALYADTTGGRNTAMGVNALRFNLMGVSNTAVGVNALYLNSANFNTAIGDSALYHNTSGGSNTATGYQALESNTTGYYNTAIGLQALQSNAGGANTATGTYALLNNSTGNLNTAIGYGAGLSATTGTGNVYVGTAVYGVAGESGHTRIRNIGSTPIIGGTNVVVATIGGIGDQVLGYASSSRRYKEDIQPMDKASETLFALKPVSFRAKSNMDPARVKYYGLIAEDVAEVDPGLVVYNPQGKPETLRFESINAMLLNEFIKEHRTVQELKKEIASLTATVKEQAAQIQKVSAQLGTGRVRPTGGLEEGKFAVGQIRPGRPATKIAVNNR